jgi:hypothetical protein
VSDERTMPDMVDDPVERFGALFTRAGDVYTPTPLARGPWDPNALHGGAPAALFASVCEQHDPGTADFMARLTVELLRPIPLTPLTLAVRTMRPGKKVQWIEASLADESEREVARATALRIRSDDVDVAGSVSPDVVAPPGLDAPSPQFPFGERDTALAESVGYWAANEVRLVRGNWAEAGPGVAWLRLRCPVVAGEPVSPFARVAAAADFGSGVGNPLRLTHATGINAELTVHTHRHPTGEWVCLESGAWAQPHGVGLAETVLHDEEGVLGRAMQSLLVESIIHRPPPGPRP